MCRQPLGRGFSLAEVLVVITIMMMLMVVAAGVLRMPGSRSSEPAARIARAVEMARAQAVANDRTVVIRFERGEGRETAMRFYRFRPGQDKEQVREYRRPERFVDLAVPAQLEHKSLPDDPQRAHDLIEGEALVVNADGQVFVGTGDGPVPTAATRLMPLIHIGVQPTLAGRVVPVVKNDVALVQVQCATGTTRVVSP